MYTYFDCAHTLVGCAPNLVENKLSRYLSSCKCVGVRTCIQSKGLIPDRASEQSKATL